MLIIKYSNSPKSFINISFDIIKLNNKSHIFPVPKNVASFCLVDNWHLVPQEALNSETSYVNVLVVHKKYVQEWFVYIRNVRTLWLVSVSKNVGSVGLI